MKKLLVILMLILTFVIAASAQKTNSKSQTQIKGLINQLNWNNVGFECNFTGRLVPSGQTAETLIKIGKPATPQLLGALADKNKAVAAHMILTRLWEPSHRFDYLINYTQADTIIYEYNDLIWTWTKRDGDKVNEQSLSEISLRWRTKLKSQSVKSLN